MQKSTINILTSCDARLIHLLPVSIQAIAHNLKEKTVNFFLMHDKIPDGNLHMLQMQCQHLGNINFHAIQVSDYDNEILKKIAQFGGANWGGPAYYSLLAYRYLPADIDRVLYLDAADTLVVKDVDEFYYEDFGEAEAIVTVTQYKTTDDGRAVPFASEDMDNVLGLSEVCRGLFNSGTYMLNLSLQRQEAVSIDAYWNYVQAFDRLYRNNVIPAYQKFGLTPPADDKTFFGDQGLFSLIFCGKLRYFAFDRDNKGQNIWYMPYNFCLWYFDSHLQPPPYEPHILHFAGSPKPWSLRYLNIIPRFQKNTELLDWTALKPGQAVYYYIWHEYALAADKLLTALGF